MPARLVGIRTEAKNMAAFLAWFEAKRRAGEEPYVDVLITTAWYKGQERGEEIAKTMWTRWFIKFVDELEYFCVAPWAPNGTTLSGNWKEPGLHFGKKASKPDYCIFRGTVADFKWPDKLLKLEWDSTNIEDK